MTAGLLAYIITGIALVIFYVGTIYLVMSSLYKDDKKDNKKDN